MTRTGNKRSLRWRRRPRLTIGASLFVVLTVAFGACGIGWPRAIVLGFALAALAFMVLVAHMFARSDIASIRSRAREEDEGGWAALSIGVVVSAVVLVALGLELHGGGSGSVFEIVLAAPSLLLSWLFMNTLFAVHYAHAYYGDDARRHKRGGLEFPGNEEPDYWDFAYFAIVVGMTFQVSDVQITSRPLRRVALVHGMIAFFFNVIIIAISVNAVAGRA